MNVLLIDSKALSSLLEEMLDRVKKLKFLHEDVNSKSLVMQSLWDGIAAEEVSFQLLFIY